MYMEFVYIIESTYGLCKIGYTTNPKKRFADIKSANPNIVLIRLYQGSLNDEKKLHEIYNDFHVRNEWFMLKDEHILNIDDYFLGKEDISHF